MHCAFCFSFLQRDFRINPAHNRTNTAQPPPPRIFPSTHCAASQWASQRVGGGGVRQDEGRGSGEGRGGKGEEDEGIEEEVEETKIGDQTQKK